MKYAKSKNTSYYSVDAIEVKEVVVKSIIPIKTTETITKTAPTVTTVKPITAPITTVEKPSVSTILAKPILEPKPITMITKPVASPTAIRPPLENAVSKPIVVITPSAPSNPMPISTVSGGMAGGISSDSSGADKSVTTKETGSSKVVWYKNKLTWVLLIIFVSGTYYYMSNKKEKNA